MQEVSANEKESKCDATATWGRRIKAKKEEVMCLVILTPFYQVRTYHSSKCLNSRVTITTVTELILSQVKTTLKWSGVISTARQQGVLLLKDVKITASLLFDTNGRFNRCENVQEQSAGPRVMCLPHGGHRLADFISRTARFFYDGGWVGDSLELVRSVFKLYSI